MNEDGQDIIERIREKGYSLQWVNGRPEDVYDSQEDETE